MSKTNAPSLVQLCIKTAVYNLNHIKDIGDTDIHLLKEILSNCTPDQLTQIENASKDRDLSSVTEGLWHQFYIEKFGVESANYLVITEEQLGVALNWRQIYEDKSKEWTIIVSANATALNRIATTPGCLRKSLDQIKKVSETLQDQLKELRWIISSFCSNASETALPMFVISVFITAFAIIIYSVVKVVIAVQ